MTRTGLFDRIRQRIGGTKNVQLHLSCYGKLPIYKDFLRENLAGKEAQALKQWLDKGVSHYWAGHESYRDETILPHAFLFRFPGTGKYVMGYLWGSHDEGKLRSFPFSMFVSLPAGREAFPPNSMLEILGVIITAGRRWRQEAASLASFSDWVQWSRNLQFKVIIRPEQEVTSEVLDRAEDLTIGDFSSSLWRSSAEQEWPCLLSYLDRHRARIEKHLHGTELAVRFPSSARIPLVLQIQIWTLVLERYDRRRDRPVQIVLPAYDDEAGITVMLRILRPDDVFAFHPEMPLNEHIEDFRGAVPRRAGDEITPLTEGEKEQPLRVLLDSKYTRTSQEAVNGN